MRGPSIKVSLLLTTAFVVCGLPTYNLGRDYLAARESAKVLRVKRESMPPLYLDLAEGEAYLPQHNVTTKSPEGKDVRFIRFGNHIWGAGLNNQLQETNLNAYIAYLSNRAYVFAPFTWDPFTDDPYLPLEQSDMHLAPSSFPQTHRINRIPVSAYLSGPTAGGPWPAGDPTPRAVSEEWFDLMCPEDTRLHLNTSEINPIIGVNLDRDEGIDIVYKWAAYLNSLDDRCVNILWETPRIIDYSILGSARLLSLWPSYSRSPVLTQFSWSPLVLKSVERNSRKFSPLSRFFGVGPITSSESIVPGLLSAHIRRGDYEGHCQKLAGYMKHNGWNRLDFLPDRFDYPDVDDWEVRRAHLIEHCWIDIDTIVTRFRELRKEHPNARLSRVFISTNGEWEWSSALKKALKRDGWKSVVTSADLDITWEESGIENAIDLELASRGEVFIGNGFSSFTSTVTRLRLVRGLPSRNIRFW